MASPWTLCWRQQSSPDHPGVGVLRPVTDARRADRAANGPGVESLRSTGLFRPVREKAHSNKLLSPWSVRYERSSCLAAWRGPN